MTNFSVFTLLGGLPGAVRGRSVSLDAGRGRGFWPAGPGLCAAVHGHGPASPFIVKNLLTRGFWRDIIPSLTVKKS